MHRHIVIALVVLCASVINARAQSSRDTGLRVTVADQTGAVIVNAKVTVVPTEPAGAPLEVVTDERGVSSVEPFQFGGEQTLIRPREVGLEVRYSYR